MFRRKPPTGQEAALIQRNADLERDLARAQAALHDLRRAILTAPRQHAINLPQLQRIADGRPEVLMDCTVHRSAHLNRALERATALMPRAPR